MAKYKRFDPRNKKSKRDYTIAEFKDPMKKRKSKKLAKREYELNEY